MCTGRFAANILRDSSVLLLKLNFVQARRLNEPIAAGKGGRGRGKGGKEGRAGSMGRGSAKGIANLA